MIPGRPIKRGWRGLDLSSIETVRNAAHRIRDRRRISNVARSILGRQISIRRSPAPWPNRCRALNCGRRSINERPRFFPPIPVRQRRRPGLPTAEPWPALPNSAISPPIPNSITSTRYRDDNEHDRATVPEEIRRAGYRSQASGGWQYYGEKLSMVQSIRCRARCSVLGEHP